jgi:hypothetical protein
MLPAIIQQLNHRCRELGYLRVGQSSSRRCEVSDLSWNDPRHVGNIDNRECSSLEG